MFKNYHLDTSKCLWAPKIKLKLLTDIDMLLMVEKWIRRGIRHTTHWYAKVNNKYMKDYDKNKEWSYLKY